MTDFLESNAVSQGNGNLKGFLQLFHIANIENPSEALSIFFHTCMIDVGFLPVNVLENDVYTTLPEGWKSAGALKFKYYHKTCCNSFCWMTCVPLYSDIAVHGSLDNGSAHSVYIKLKTTKYLNNGINLTDPVNLFISREKLIRKFKDGFCYPLLALLQESAGCEPSFGFSRTVDDIKLHIMRLLPFQNIIALSSVNKAFNRVANAPFLWKYLLQRDFGLVDDSSNLAGDDYKNLYKREYLKRKQRTRRHLPFTDPYYLPSILPPERNIYVDPRIDLDPAIQQAFPNLRDRFRPNWLFPYNFPGRYM